MNFIPAITNSFLLRTSCALISVLSLLSIPAYSFPSSGGNCANCHGDVAGSVSVSGNLTIPTTLAVPTRLDSGNTGTLPSFTVTAGVDTLIQITITLAAVGGDGVALGDQYSFSLGGTLKPPTATGKDAQESLASASTVSGIKTASANKLVFTLGTNTGWTTRTVGTKTYFTRAATSWPSSTTSLSTTFDMTIGATTPADVYTMTARAGWVGSDTFGNSQEFLINVIPEPGVFAMLGLGAIGLVAWHRKRRKI